MIFKYRYVIVILLFLILVSNKIHFSSIGIYDRYIQPGYGSEFTAPIFGMSRIIRSDEWSVDTPLKLSAQYGSGQYGYSNPIARGTETVNMPFGMNIATLATVSNPLYLFFFIGSEYGISALWIGMLLISFMVVFEFMYIIARGNRLLAMVGACLLVFSPFFQWWSYVGFITAGIGTLVCFYYFLGSDKKVSKLLFALGIVVFFSQFVVSLYPPWLVPAGYLYLGLAIWIIVENWDKVKSIDKLDWGILCLTIIFIAAVVGSYLWESREYTAAIMNTVYPGARHLRGGTNDAGHLINGLMNGGVFAPISAFKQLAYSNICEIGGIYTLFPVPILFISYFMIRKKAFDLFSVILIAFSLIITSYIFIGWPEWLTRITLMSNSTSPRAIDVVQLAQSLLLVRAISMFTEPGGAGNKSIIMRILAGSVAVSICLTYIALYFNKITFSPPINSAYFVHAFIGFVLVVYSIFDFQRNKRIYKAACAYLIILSCMTFLTIHPVMRGLDAIYSKPLSKKITELAVNSDEKWISLDNRFFGSPFLIASGASTVNSTNFYPNLELWYKLDPEHIYEDIYNRYAHVSVELVKEDTSFEIVDPDHFRLYLSYHDLAIAGVKYIHTAEPLDGHGDVSFTLLYTEGGSMIYSVSNDSISGNS